MMPPVVSVERVSKRYVKYDDAPMLLGAVARLRTRNRRSRFWALRDISFDIHEGTSVGIIGRNGSGKTTLLRLLAGITAPTGGAVTVRGRVAPLISVGVGFHQELTGRENVYANGVILGLTKSHIDRIFDEIVDFAELQAFIDTPVKFYSSGMFVRLGFAVAVAADPEVLLVDEVLAVGDFAFQQKCFARIAEIREGGATIILVTHSMQAIRMQCARTMVLHQGELRHDGDTNEAIQLYQELVDTSRDADQALLAGETFIDVSCSVDRLEVVNGDGAPTSVVSSGQDIAFEFDVSWARDVVDPMLGVMLFSDQGVLVYADHSHGDATGSFVAGQRSTFRLEATPRLATGNYTLRLMIFDHDGRGQLLPFPKSVSFFFAGRPSVSGAADLDGRFLTVDGRDES
jgi:ABC-2 type transport system ATP-binding protein